MLSRDEFERVRRALSGLSFSRELVLVGSSALFALDSRLPPETEDVDVVVPEDILCRTPERVRGALEASGLVQVEATATWMTRDGLSVDLLAVAHGVTEDRVGGTPAMPAMVFADLARIILDDRSRGVVPGRPGHLSRAGLALSKLLTVRLEKGPKDRIHALLLIQEGAADAESLASLSSLIGELPASQREDLLPEAQLALVTISGAGVGAPDAARAYASRVDAAREGFELLREVLARW